VKAGSTDSTTVVASVDLLPTLCKITGVDLPKSVAFDGVDRSAAIQGEPLGVRDKPLMWEYGRNEKFFGYPRQPRDRSPQLAIRDGNWKLLLNANGEDAELYDLSSARDESHNVASEHPEETTRLKTAILDWRRSLP
jgi:arylsulfatase A-like enzyme